MLCALKTRMHAKIENRIFAKSSRSLVAVCVHFILGLYHSHQTHSQSTHRPPHAHTICLPFNEQLCSFDGIARHKRHPRDRESTHSQLYASVSHRTRRDIEHSSGLCLISIKNSNELYTHMHEATGAVRWANTTAEWYGTQMWSTQSNEKENRPTNRADNRKNNTTQTNKKIATINRAPRSTLTHSSIVSFGKQKFISMEFFLLPILPLMLLLLLFFY